MADGRAPTAIRGSVAFARAVRQHLLHGASISTRCGERAVDGRRRAGFDQAPSSARVHDGSRCAGSGAGPRRLARAGPRAVHVPQGARRSWERNGRRFQFLVGRFQGAVVPRPGPKAPCLRAAGGARKWRLRTAGWRELEGFWMKSRPAAHGRHAVSMVRPVITIVTRSDRIPGPRASRPCVQSGM